MCEKLPTPAAWQSYFERHGSSQYPISTSTQTIRKISIGRVWVRLMKILSICIYNWNAFSVFDKVFYFWLISVTGARYWALGTRYRLAFKAQGLTLSFSVSPFLRLLKSPNLKSIQHPMLPLWKLRSKRSRLWALAGQPCEVSSPLPADLLAVLQQCTVSLEQDGATACCFAMHAIDSAIMYLHIHYYICIPMYMYR